MHHDVRMCSIYWIAECFIHNTDHTAVKLLEFELEEQSYIKCLHLAYWLWWHIDVSVTTVMIIGVGNGLFPVWYKAIAYTCADWLTIWHHCMNLI